MSMPITPYVWELEGDIYKWMNLNFLHFLDESSSLQSLLHSRPPNYSLERNDSSRLEIVLPSITSLEVEPSMHSNLDTISREILEASKGISRSLRENETRGWLQAPLFSKEYLPICWTMIMLELRSNAFLARGEWQSQNWIGQSKYHTLLHINRDWYIYSLST